MKTDKKDKLIIALIIGIVLILAKNFKDNNQEIIIEDQNNQIQKNSSEIELNSNNENIIKAKKVHISGEVNKAGVYEIDDEDRLEQLVNKAGGLTKNADLDAINLSMLLEDQMRIIIPNINNHDKNIEQFTVLDSPSKSDKKININKASKEELMSLPNVGEKRAEAIIEYRKMNNFEKIDDIKKVSGIGDKYFEQMKDLIKTN